ncbi:hypothetical protein CEXT_15101 [Caerostris extrusa]|uniref:Uncharacterized protein n=1 Tax=Caerostris extrusa TaxID=172846 RepID=A0AAV4MD83_CAEEX|nr:hypothetical protein CEXT_15101 [Caerostris extrusa]
MKGRLMHPFRLLLMSFNGKAPNYLKQGPLHPSSPRPDTCKLFALAPTKDAPLHVLLLMHGSPLCPHVNVHSLRNQVL